MSVSLRTPEQQPLCPIGLGCMSLTFAYGGQPTQQDAVALLHSAIDLGYNHLDTARLYGNGDNEVLVGKALKGQRHKVFLASKAGIFPGNETRRVDCRPETLRSACETSLRALQTDHIDLYYLHRHDYDTPIEDSIGALAELIAAGKIGGIGLSEVSAETLRRAAAVHPVAAVQNEYSLWTRNPELGVLETCRQLGTAFVAFSPLGRGVLANGVRDPSHLADNDFRQSMPRFQPDNWAHNRRLIDDFNRLAAEHAVTPAQLALAWVLSRGEHVLAIPGTGQIAHMQENIARCDWRADAGLLQKLDELINQHTVAGHRYADAMRQNIDTEEFPAP